MSESVMGIVEDVINLGVGKGSGIRVNGHKFGIYDPTSAGLDKVSVGTGVSFQFKETNKGGITYRNITGRVTPLADGVAVPAATKPVDSGSTTSSGTGRYRQNGMAGGFPIHPHAYERALDRRNALNAAVALVSASPSATIADVTDVLAIAKQFEEYTCGDAERVEEEALNSLMKEEDL